MIKRKINTISAILVLASVTSAYSQIQINLNKSFADSLGCNICANIGFTPEREMSRYTESGSPVTNGRSAYSSRRKTITEIFFSGEDKISGVRVLCRIINSAGNTDAAEYLESKLNKTANIYGVWGLWFYSYGKRKFIQGESTNEAVFNQECYFEISPLLNVDGIKTGYMGNDFLSKSGGIESALESYASAKLIVSSRDSILTISARGTKYEPAHFTLEKNGEGEIRGDGIIAECNIYDDSGFLVYEGMRIIFIKNSNPETRFKGMKSREQLNVIALPRISIHDILSRIEKKEDGRECIFETLPVEMVILSTYNN
ncbi:MAG: hypothetical protein LWX07_11735 [Bacteroidetes bacterium]|nr:hypothetical protein [Bacteroidota bacterium]